MRTYYPRLSMRHRLKQAPSALAAFLACLLALLMAGCVVPTTTPTPETGDAELSSPKPEYPEQGYTEQYRFDQQNIPIKADGSVDIAKLPSAVTIPTAEPYAAFEDSGKQTRYTETGDLAAIRSRGQLRILVVEVNNSANPLLETSLDWQRDTAVNFAIELGLEPILIELERLEDAVPMLLQGQVDLVASNITVTKERRKRMLFSQPFTHVREQALVRASDRKLKKPADMSGRTVTLDPTSAFWGSIQKLRRSWPGIRVDAQPMVMSEELLDQVASGEIDITIHQSNLITPFLAHRDDVRVAFNITRSRPLAWAMRPDSIELQRALNSYFVEQQLQGEPSIPEFGDWQKIKQRGVLRVLLRNNAVSYFLRKNRLVGFEYELLKAFALREKLRLEIVVPTEEDNILRMLEEGFGDVAAGFLTPQTQSRLGIQFTDSYFSAPQILISRAGDRVKTLDDLAGRIVTVREDSSYWRPLTELENRGLGFAVLPADPELETEDLLEAVAKGEIEVTVAGGPIARLPVAMLPGLTRGAKIGGNQKHGWAVRGADNELRSKLNAFIKKNKRGSTFFNVLWLKYFGDRGLLMGHLNVHATGDRQKYDALINRYAKRYSQDPDLVAAVISQESAFDPKRKSRSGALGLMQVMKATGRQMGVTNLRDPELGLKAGVKYLAWLNRQLDEDIPFSSRVWFVLAAYNAGLGHMRDARKLAKKLGYSHTRWFGGVEKSMLLLAQPKYAKQARHGYARGGETVHYVRAVRRQFQAYRRLDEPTN